MPSKKSARPKSPTSSVEYQLKITLRGSKPPIWRRILVPDCTLEGLHAAIQTAMGWYNSHLHAFEISGQEYSGRTPFGDQLESDGLDAAAYRLSDVVDREKFKFDYQYDFGDSWDHVITVEKILPSLLDVAAPKSSQPFVCLAGKGACPLEDCGGIWSYYNLLEILRNPKHSEHADMKEWAGNAIDPDAFDLAAANQRMTFLGKL